MTRSHLIGQIVFSVLGISVLSRALIATENLTRYEWHQTPDIASIALISQLTLIALGLILAYVGLFKGGWIIRRMVGQFDTKDTYVKKTHITAAFRVAAVLTGLLILGRALYLVLPHFATLAKCIRILPDMLVHQYVDELYKRDAVAWISFAAQCANLVLAVYLVLGAPRYLRWQLRYLDRQMPHVQLQSNTERQSND